MNLHAKIRDKKAVFLDLDNTLYSYAPCHAEALKYTNKKDFYTHSQPAYVCASKYKWINTICSHMSKNNEKLKPI